MTPDQTGCGRPSTPWKSTLAATLMCGLGVGSLLPASAQEAPSAAGKVVLAGGPSGAVIVMRGAQAYALQTGDILFLGDRIYTRSNGSAKLSVEGCEKELGATASIVIDAAICKAVPVTLSTKDLGVGGAATLAVAAPVGAGIGQTPQLLGLLAAGGGAAAAAATSSNAVDLN